MAGNGRMRQPPRTIDTVRAKYSFPANPFVTPIPALQLSGMETHATLANAALKVSKVEELLGTPVHICQPLIATVNSSDSSSEPKKQVRGEDFHQWSMLPNLLRAQERE
jgi:hypothetical protein